MSQSPQPDPAPEQPHGQLHGQTPKHTHPRVRLPVWLKIAAVMAALASLAAATMGGALTPLYRQSLTASSLEFGAAVASDVAQTMNARVATARAGLVDVGRTLTDTSLEGDERVQRALLLVEGNLALDHAAIYDRSGQLIDVLRQEGSSAPAPPERLPDALRQALVSLKLRGLAVGQPQGRLAPLAIALTRDAQVTGYVFTHLDLEQLQERVTFLSEARFGGRRDALMVVDWQGQILAHSEPARRGQRELHVPMVLNKTPDLVAAGVSEVGAYQAQDRAPFLAAYQPLAEAPWAVVAQIPDAVAFAPLRAMQRRVGAVLLASLVAALLLAFGLSWRLLRPVGQLVLMARALGQRRYEQAQGAPRTGDELEQVGLALGQAAKQLQTSEAQLLREERIRQDLGRFLPAELVDRVVSQQLPLALGGERVQVTVLFADVVGFTPLCERLKPEDTVALLNELFTIMTEIVFRHHGTVDKFMGDCMMAFWAPPQSPQEHATRALEAAEEILSWLAIGNASWRVKYGLQLELAVGVNTGEAIIGNVGSTTRMEYTVIGDAVNVAARLEAIARPMQILVTQATLEAADAELFDAVEIGHKQLAGHDSPTLIYEVRP